MAAFVFLGAMFVIVYREFKDDNDYEDPSKTPGHHHKLHDKSIPSHRLMEMAKLVCTFSFAWCTLGACAWELMEFQNQFGWTDNWKVVVEALGVTFACVGIIRLLDKIADLDATGPAVDEAVRTSVLAFGVLIGFCWEHAFDLGIVAAVLRVKAYPEIMQFLACSFIAMVIMPAYIMYIVPIQFKMAVEEEEEEQPDAI
jgi:hypothetical protein